MSRSATACELCPSNSTNLPDVANVGAGIEEAAEIYTFRSASQCRCFAGYAGRSNGTVDTVDECVECVSGMECKNSGTMLHSVYIEPGYWRATNTTAVVHKCSVGGCKGGAGASGDAGCEENHFGMRCRECNNEQGFFASKNGCAVCEDKKIGHVFALLVPTLFPFVPVFLMVRGTVRGSSKGFQKNADGTVEWISDYEERKAKQGVALSAVIKIAISYFQVVTVVFSLSRYGCFQS